MKKLLIMAALSLFLGACSQNGKVDLRTTTLEVVMPSATLLRCPLTKLPASFKDNKEVAQSYVKIWRTNQFCHNNMESIKKFLDDASKNIGNNVY